MRRWHVNTGLSAVQGAGALALLLFLAFLLVVLFRHDEAPRSPSVFERSVQKLQLLQTMSRDLLASAEAEKSAVMAETDELSQALATQALQATQQVETARRGLESLLEGDRRETQLFGEFQQCWTQLQAIDREVLSLAVQNTNLKALRLSILPAAEALRSLDEALNQLMDRVASSAEALHLTRLAATVATAAFKLYILQTPHILESSVTHMEEIEAVMHRLDLQITTALHSLQMLLDEPDRAVLETARTAYHTLQQLNADILALSRQNSTIQAYALSLGQKRKMTAQCQAVLTALQEHVQQQMTFKATK
ncbi:MAG: MCP four helix bundle domain-containing protein [Candidatus Tectimicrobiota bacterium]